jgi:Dual-action HEIGH metallo-peptidase
MTKFYKFTVAAALLATFSLGACQQEEGIVKKEDISRETLSRISQLGFGTSDVKKVENGYLVEGDILLTDAQLAAPNETKLLRVGETEQYRTTNLVTGLPRVIKVSVSKTLPLAYATALNEAIARYNAQGLQLTFQRVTSGAHIAINKAPSTATYLASAGFPAYGNPYNSVLINSTYLGTNPGTSYLASILAHEIGHCIGFRHTDYMDRAYSCGGAVTNEGAGTIGAIEIPGTPTVQDPDSWMLACIGTGQSRPFNANDIIALDYLY